MQFQDHSLGGPHPASLTPPTAGWPDAGRGLCQSKDGRPETRLRGPCLGLSHPGTRRVWAERPPAQSVLEADQGFDLGEIPVGLEEARVTQGLALIFNLWHHGLQQIRGWGRTVGLRSPQ